MRYLPIRDTMFILPETPLLCRTGDESAYEETIIYQARHRVIGIQHWSATRMSGLGWVFLKAWGSFVT